MTTPDTSPLTPADLPADFSELAYALVQTRKRSGAAVAVHDLRLASRLVYLGMAEVSAKGLRGTEALENLLGRFGAKVLAQSLCEDVSASASASVPASAPAPAPAPTVSLAESAASCAPAPTVNPSAVEPLRLNAFLLDEGTARDKCPRRQPVTAAPVVEQPLAPVASEAFPNATATPPLLKSTDLDTLSQARKLRDEIGRLTKELQTLLQPITEKVLACSDADEIASACALFPASLQRNALLAQLKALAPSD